MAARGPSEDARIALKELCEAYYHPVNSFLRRTGRDADAARELAHGFFEAVLSRTGFEGADRERGRFRSYLLGALKNFLAKRHVRELREKRGAGVPHIPLEGRDESVPEIPAGEWERHEEWFDHEWAVSLVERVLSGLKSECVTEDSTKEFSELKPWLGTDDVAEPQAVVASRLGVSEGAVKVAIHRLRRRFRERLRAEVSQTLPAGESVDDEVRHLIRALAKR